jgi:putative two-component system response regulator
MDGYAVIAELKKSCLTKDIPVIFLTAMTSSENEIKGLKLGAVDYIFKPFAGALLLKRIETHLFLIECQKELKLQNLSIQKMLLLKTGQVWSLQNAVLQIVADLVECRDDVTGGHVSRTQQLLRCMIEKLNEQDMYVEETSTWNLDFVLPSAQLHDVGKIGISDVILNKPAKLTSEEFEIMKTHVQIGVGAIHHMEQITDDHSFFRHAEAFAGGHHERWDGKGYPKGLKGADIPLEGRVMALVDVYDALVSLRPYKPALPVQQANSIIIEGRGSHFDPQVVDIFTMVTDQFAEVARKGSETQKAASF